MATRILVVEDDLLNRMFYHEVLGARGFEVQMVSDGAAVLDEVDRFAPDLITMDIQLPHISGLRLIRRLQRQEETKGIPIVAITAFAGKGEEQRIIEAGARAYLAKPVSVDKLVGAVEGLIERAH
ncbi:response regulator [Alteraurantiacibacter aquimixticola]|uniref:Response regulator n=1 Tax=Alteraurantiacibacter aquimixticola TaxID=2489173 RepID=A0A4T3F185_9SPHN|nr:response regulator [Alteraurantiacibacter aquimixticola]TIX49122.1 response regulator [Alteraurantiacibacter aquimixticola]